jgi:hypothetical protein
MVPETPASTRFTGATPDWLRPVGAAGALGAAFILGYVALYGGHLSALVCADREKIGRPPFEAVKVGFPAQGFDGQYYYVLARDPWHRTEAFIDLPAYRHSRIVYPALAWLISGGDARALLWILPAVNWLALVGIAWLGALIARHYGRTPWWGLVLPLALNAIPPALRNLTDPVATFTAIAVVAAWAFRCRAWTFAPLCALALLAREQNLLIVALVALEGICNRRYRVAVSAAGAVCVWIGWVVLLRSVYGEWPFLQSNTEVPFTGIWYRLHHMTGPLGSPNSVVHAPAVAMLVAHLVVTVRLVAARPERLPGLIALAGAALALQAGTPIYLNLESYTRVFWWMPFGLWLWGVQTGRVWPGVFAVFGLLWPGYALAQAWYKMHQGGVTIL